MRGLFASAFSRDDKMIFRMKDRTRSGVKKKADVCHRR